MQPDIKDHHLLETILATSRDPISIEELKLRMRAGADIEKSLSLLSEEYQHRGIQVVELAGGWTIMTKPEHSELCRQLLKKPIKLTNATLETLVIIAYFQPVTRSEIERIRGVSLAKGTLDLLLWSGWVRPGARRQTPGTPLTFVTTENFLGQFNFKNLDDLPLVNEYRAQGVLNADKDLGQLLSAFDSEIIS